MHRRKFIGLTACSLMAPVAGLAQQAKVRRIGFLRVGPPPAAFIEGFRQGLRELGLVEGQHFTIEYGGAERCAYPRLQLNWSVAASTFSSPLERRRCCRPGTLQAKRR